MSKLEKWQSAEIRAVFYGETQRGTTPMARNRASWLVSKQNARERKLRNQIVQQTGRTPEELLRRKMAK